MENDENFIAIPGFSVSYNPYIPTEILEKKNFVS